MQDFSRIHQWKNCIISVHIVIFMVLHKNSLIATWKKSFVDYNFLITIACWRTCFPFRISRYRNYGAFHNRQIPKRCTLTVSVLSELSERALFHRLVFRSAGSDGAVGLFRSPNGQAEVCSVIP